MWNETLCERSFGGLPQMTVDSLSAAEQFVLGVCRCWDAFLDDPDPALPWRELTPVFAYMNVMDALCAFDRAFGVLYRHRPQSLRFQDTDSLTLGLDEARVLCGLACLQRGNARATIAVLRPSLTRRAIPAVLPPLARVASILDREGHRLPRWTDAPAEDQAKTGPCGAGRNFFAAAIPTAMNTTSTNP